MKEMKRTRGSIATFSASRPLIGSTIAAFSGSPASRHIFTYSIAESGVVDAGFTRRSYAPGENAEVEIACDARSLRLQVFAYSRGA